MSEPLIGDGSDPARRVASHWAVETVRPDAQFQSSADHLAARVSRVGVSLLGIGGPASFPRRRHKRGLCACGGWRIR
jgi:hypothetical protein